MQLVPSTPEAPPAGGAALDQVFGMTAAAAVVSAILLVVAYQHHSGRITWLQRLADALGARTNRPGWVALPTVLVTISLVTALFGFLWDVSLHIGRGRDSGPLANPAHYFILVGLFAMFIAGMLAIVLPCGERPGPASLKITRDWHAPVGGVLIAGAGLYALIGFPLDDVWHRIFGQDVTLWGPTHLMLIGGAGLSLIGVQVLERESDLATRGTASDRDSFANWLTRVAAAGALVIGLSVFQGEYDFGVEQFRLVLQPMMIAGAAALALVAARMLVGRGGAVLAAVFFIGVRGVVTVLVGPVLGEPHVWFPLYLGEAIVVELIAMTRLSSRPLAFGAASGLGIATVGLALERIWIDRVYPLPWPPSIFAESLAMAIPVAVLTGICGAMLATALRDGHIPRPAVSRTVVVAAALVVAAGTANGLIATVPEDATATIALQDVTGEGAARTASADVRLSPASVAGDDPTWVEILAWQGGSPSVRGLVLDRLERTDPGSYASSERIPIGGDWKTVLRIQDGRTITAAPVFLPADEAIGVPEVSAASTTRPGCGGWHRSPSCSCSVVLVWSMAWGVARVARSGRPTPTAPTTADVPDRLPVRL